MFNLLNKVVSIYYCMVSVARRFLGFELTRSLRDVIIICITMIHISGPPKGWLMDIPQPLRGYY